MKAANMYDSIKTLILNRKKPCMHTNGIVNKEFVLTFLFHHLSLQPSPRDGKQKKLMNLRTMYVYAAVCLSSSLVVRGNITKLIENRFEDFLYPHIKNN